MSRCLNNVKGDQRIINNDLSYDNGLINLTDSFFLVNMSWCINIVIMLQCFDNVEGD